jgi:hypothetical protein
MVTRHARPAQLCKRERDQDSPSSESRSLYGPGHAGVILDRILPKLLRAWVPQSGVPQ